MKEKQKTNYKHLNFDTDKKKVGSVGDKNMYVYFLIITSKKCCNNVSFICRVFGNALFNFLFNVFSVFSFFYVMTFFNQIRATFLYLFMFCVYLFRSSVIMISIKMHEKNRCASGEYFKLRLELFHLTLGCQQNCFVTRKTVHSTMVPRPTLSM